MGDHTTSTFDFVKFANVSQLDHAAIMASAGSGKTFRLIHRYLQLLFAGAEPSTILATTFTRAAAGEIRDRVLSRLASAAIDDASREELSLTLFADVALLTTDDILHMLARLAREMHTMQIRTLDSFFAGIVRCFSLELGLPADAAIVDEHDAMLLRRESIRLMLDERDAQPLVDVLRSLIDGRSDRGVMGMIERDVAAMHALFREAPAIAWQQIDRRATLDENERRRAIDAIANTAGSLELPKSHENRIPKDLESAAGATLDLAVDWIDFLTKGLAPKIITGDDYSRKPINPEVATAYQPLIAHAIATCRNYLASRTEATFELLQKYEIAYLQAQAQRGVLTFNDLVQSVANQADDLLLSDIYYRLDGRINHLLLDEMQDTSVQQWQGLEPIASELLAVRAEPGPDGRSFFCVGDVKQSIYNWRGACPELLESLPELYTGHEGDSAIDVQTLSKSWRSSPVIMDVVNKVFTKPAMNPAVEGREVAATEFAKSFINHETARTELPGYVELRTMPEPSDDKDVRVQTRLQQAADLVAELHNRNPRKTIGVLTRTNAAINRLLFELGPSRRKVPATGRGGGSLTDTPPVNVMLDLLRLADHPADSISAFNVRHSPLGPHVGLTLCKDPNDKQREQNRVARRIRRDIQSHGLVQMLDNWASAVAHDCDARQLQRVYELVRLAYSVDENRSLRTDDFVRMVETTRVPDSSQSTIEVMTIHQSKGLEFDIVILPELEWAFSSKVDLLVDRDSIAGPISMIVRGATSSIAPLFQDTAPMRERDLVRQVREDLCLIYVAMTRAKQGLYMFIDPTYKGKSNKTAAGMIWHALGSDDKTIPPDSIVFARGDSQWIEQQEKHETPLDSDESPTHDSFDSPGIEFTISDHRPLIVAPSPSAMPHDDDDEIKNNATDGNTLANQLRISPVDAFDRGNAWHAMFETIEWIDAIDLHSPSFLENCRRAARRAAGRRDAAWITAQVSEFCETLQSDVVHQALSRPSPDAFVQREMPFVRRTPKGLQTGAIDRLVVELEEGQPVAATIIDFKTDPIMSDACEEKAAGYAAQLLAYREAVAEVWNLPFEHIEASLLFVVPRVLTTVHSSSL